MRRIALSCLASAAITVVQPAVARSAFWTTSDPFVGKWRLDISRSTIVDDMRVQALGSNRYGFNFEGGPTEIIVADGTDQPGLPGTTLAVKAADAHSLTVVRKQDGRTIVSASWKLSEDGRTLRDAFTSLQPDGSSATVDYVYKRLSGTSGFAGAWESTTKPTGLKLKLQIQPYGSKGFSFASAGSNRSVTFDGREHAVPGDKDGLTFSGRRRGARAMQYTEKNRGVVQRARQFELSRDGRTLTETLRTPGHATPDVFVFERE
jgi:hypothetical protein